ncbi:uncharacterized protein C10orf67, mitochondrial isoform X2 [Pocillopora verrucosa]|uniref:uncharacterized protein C10orf67, mitochondrial isoform X2 n=1 Tax=Pocillopora verrucosa TaxID=203993 RepID=UPI0027974A2B|nr:uncharacterized protein C10orf67, mitochondrial-like isoform X2 [Pocillopora verrucosa]
MAAEPKAIQTPEMSPTVRKSVSSRPGSISPALMNFPGSLMELDEYRPSIADQVRVGYFSQDRSSQTEVSEIAQLKEMTEVLQNLVRDIENLKRSLHYAKHVLQADYENKLQERALDLYCRVNDRILELEKQHEDRVNVIRRSYRQQLADAITQISSQHQEYYAKKSKQDKAKFSEKLRKVQDDDEEKKKAKQQQDSIIEMMKMQMRDAQERADRELQDALNRPKSASSVATNPEIYELREEVEKLENKVDDLMNQLDDKETENRRLATDIDDLNEQLRGDRQQIQQLKKDLSDALLAAEHERNNFKAELQSQRAQLEREMDNKLQETKTNLMAASRKQVEELQRAHDQKIKEQKIIDEKRKLMESQQTKSTTLAPSESTTVIGRPLTERVPVVHYEPGVLVSRLRRMEKPQLNESEKDDLLRKLQKLEKKQKAEILRLQKELDRVNRTWEMKVTILQQTLHALKDESFLRTSLQRQAARLQHAAVVYASDGPAVIVTDRKDYAAGRPYRTLVQPDKTKHTVPFNTADRPAADTPFSEDRPTPTLPLEDKPRVESNEDTSLIANPAGVDDTETEEKNENSSMLESSTSAHQVVDPV